MSRAELSTTRYHIGPCECPGEPHANAEAPTFVLEPDDGDPPQLVARQGPLAKGDWADFKDRLTFGDSRRIQAVIFYGDGIVRAVSILHGITAWSLTDERAEPLPITIETIDALSVEQGQKLLEIIDRPQFRRRLPNPTGGPSAGGSAEVSTPTSSAAATPTGS